MLVFFVLSFLEKTISNSLFVEHQPSTCSDYYKNTPFTHLGDSVDFKRQLFEIKVTCSLTNQISKVGQRSSNPGERGGSID